MKGNRVNKTLTDAEKQQVLNLLGQLEQLLNFEVQLTPEERKKVLKAGDKTIPFLRLIRDNLDKIAPYLPAFIDKDEVMKDIILYFQLRDILLKLSIIQDKVEDAMFVAGGEAFQQSLAIYGILKEAAKRGNVGGLDPIIQELAKRFPQNKRKKNDEEIE